MLRVSAMISNSPYILVLDCDMYCHGSSSARQAMCFHLDPKMSPSLAFVQFPQKFHNISKNDIYNCRIRSLFTILWKGMDGLMKEDVDIMKSKQDFGSSNDFIKSLGRHYKPNHSDFSNAMLFKEIQILASCAYENQTKWGQRSNVGFLYFSVVEDYFTDFINLHGKGWISVYCNPARPAFLGSGTTNLSDVVLVWLKLLSQGSVLFYIAQSRRRSRCLFLRECAMQSLPSFLSISSHCGALQPFLSSIFSMAFPYTLMFQAGIFIVFSFIFLSSQSKHIQEILSTGGSIQTWSNEQRMWMIRSVTSHLYGSLDALGMREASFLPTNKAIDDEQLKRYQMGKFDFQASNMLIVPVVALVILNPVSLFGGVSRMGINGSFNEMFMQVGLSFFIVSMSYPIVEGMVVRKDKVKLFDSWGLINFLVCTILSGHV
ncbi:unnamed protein product [Camellia sinensis]